MSRALGVLLALLLAFGGCNGDDGEGGSERTTTVPTASTTTTAHADPYAIPAVIDEAYAQKVVNELDRIDGAATRIVVSEGRFTEDAATHVAAVYLQPELDEQLRLWTDDVRDGLEEYLAPPGDVRSTVTRVLVAKPGCIQVEVDRDFSDVARDADKSALSFMTLLPKNGSQDRRSLNATPWMVAAAVTNTTAPPPHDAC
ncbi:MAG TPA: hypothetical protein VF230_13445 [Acidimicrobiales bacterium]